MMKINIGDVFGIGTSKGDGYFQYIHHHKTIGELIRILPGLYLEQPQDLELLVLEKEIFFIHFPVGAAFKRKIVKFIGNFDLPAELEIPQKFRSAFADKFGNRICWHIVDYETWKRESVAELSIEQKKLSPWGAWNDTLLIERLVAGWTPEKWI
jgi:hypothetical protein